MACTDSKKDTGITEESAHSSMLGSTATTTGEPLPAPGQSASTVPVLPLPDHLEDAFDKLGVASELLMHWEAIEGSVLPSARPDSHDQKASAEHGTPAKVRGAALWCLQQILVDMRLPMEAWFDGASLIDSYLAHAREDGTADCTKQLPLVVTVIARMLKKENHQECPYFYNFSSIPAWVAQHLGSLGHPVKVDQQVAANELAHAEHAVLKTVGWRVHSPTLASWTTAFFKRLDVLSETSQREQIRLAWQRALLMGQVLVAKQAPTADCSPKHLARGILVLSMMSAEAGSAAAEKPAGRTLNLEAAAGATASMLREDCRVAVAAIRRAGRNPWKLGGAAEPASQPQHACV